MRKSIKYLLIGVLTTIILVLSALYLMQLDIAVLHPKGAIGVQQKDLFWIATFLMLIVVIPVFVLTFVIVWKYRANHPKSKYTPDWNHSTLAEIIWWGIPCAIIVVLGVLNWKACFDLDPYKPIVSDKKPITIQVVALQWRWLFIYPEEGIATVNYIQVPVDTPIHFVITADAPMNSFWIPDLGGQIFAMPAMRTELYLIANQKGLFRGVSANLSGSGFSQMVFWTKATSRKKYDRWVESIQDCPDLLDIESYKLLAKPSQDDKAAYFQLCDPKLFEWILKRDSSPQMEEENGL